jgi:transposase
MTAIIVSAPAALREQLDRVTGKMELVLRVAALRQGPITSTTASIARHWLAVDDEIEGHDAHLD